MHILSAKFALRLNDSPCFIDNKMEKPNKKVAHFNLEKVLGSGMFAKVYLATSELDGKKYAIKTIQKSV